MRIIITILLVAIAPLVAIHSTLMRKILAILFVGIGLCSLLLPSVKWDGFEYRDVKIAVMTASQTPVPGARVVFRDRYDFFRRHGDDYVQMTSAERQEWMDVHCPSGVTDAEGVFVFRAVFPASGSTLLFWCTGGFGLHGTVTVEADGYQTVECPLSKLAGRSGLPIRSHRKKPIAVECTLEALEKEPPSN